MDARDLQRTKYENEEEVNPLGRIINVRGERERLKLAKCKQIETFESKINIRSNLIYKEDFDLGDVVTCISKKWGITIDSRITEIEEVYEEDGFNVNVVFGNRYLL